MFVGVGGAGESHRMTSGRDDVWEVEVRTKDGWVRAKHKQKVSAEEEMKRLQKEYPRAELRVRRYVPAEK